MSFGNNEGLWSNRAVGGTAVGNLRKVMRESDPVPASAGVDYDGLTFQAPINFWTNSSGRLAFFVNLNDFTRSLWIEQVDGTLRPIVKEFAMFDVRGDGSDMRLVSSLIMVANNSNSSDGRRSAFNNDGDVTFRLKFADGTEGIFTTAAPVQSACRADFNNDGSIDPDDLGDYINCYFAVPACPQADFNGDNSQDPDDLGDFINVYFGGCE